MKLSEKQQLIIAVSAVVLIAGFVLFCYYPMVKKSRDIKQARAEQLDANLRADNQRRQLPTLHEQLEKLRRQVSGYDVKIPQDRRFAGLWQQIADIMNTHELKDQLVQPGREKQGTELNCIPISIHCSGSLKQIFEFFVSLEKLERLIYIEHVQLLNDVDFTGWVKMQAQANIYYRPAVKENI